MCYSKNCTGFLLLSFFLSGFLLLSGCSENETIVGTKIDTEATADAAESIAGALVASDGGLLDQLEDVLLIASPGGISGTANSPDGDSGTNNTRIVSRSYDSASGWWTTVISRERGNPGGLYYASFERTYKHQYLNKNGASQKFYITPNGNSHDTAYSVRHEIVSGSGLSVRPTLTHRLLSLSGKWNATGTNTDVVTLNTLIGYPLTRTASDTVKRGNSIRTLNNELVLNFTEVKGPRGSGIKLHRKISGTITGTYHATVTFLRGTVYREKEINRTIHITLGGEKIGVKIGSESFLVDPTTGSVGR